MALERASEASSLTLSELQKRAGRPEKRPDYYRVTSEVILLTLRFIINNISPFASNFLLENAIVVTPHALDLAPPFSPATDPLPSHRGAQLAPVAPMAAAGAGPASLDERTLESRELLAGGREVRIRHGADFYRLRVTQNGKLILQK
jgi:hemin uptake protein HemP